MDDRVDLTDVAEMHVEGASAYFSGLAWDPCARHQVILDAAIALAALAALPAPDPAPEGPIAPLVMLQQVREAMEEGGFTPTTDNGYIGTLIDIRKLAEAAADPAPEEPVPCCHPSSTGIDQTVPEDRIVPDGWRVEWAFPLGFDPYPFLVPLSDTPHEEGADR